MKSLAIIFFAVMCIAQWLVPGAMIYERENIIRSGALLKFATEPVDPSDPFRGKYVILNYKEDFVYDTSSWQSGEEAFVQFSSDTAGFAHANAIFREEPESGVYIRTHVLYTDSDSLRAVHFTIPFDRFYLEESKAAPAEQQYRTSQSDTTNITYGLVRIGNGKAVLVDVLIDGKSIKDIVVNVSPTTIIE